MSQNVVDFSGDPSGTVLLDDLLTDLMQNVYTNHAGTSRPSYVQAGMMWINITTNPWVVNFFDGTNDVALATINTSTHVLTITGTMLASAVSYVNSGTGLSSTDVDSAIDELALSPPVGAREIKQLIKSSAYTLVAADAGKQIVHPSADTSARTWTIPDGLPDGTAISFVNQDSAGVITIAMTTETNRLAGAGTTGSRTLAANGMATMLKSDGEWMIAGTGIT